MAKRKMTIGMRNIKTAISVIICVILTRIFALIGENTDMGIFEPFYNFVFVRSTPLYSCIAAVVSMGSTVGETVETGLARIVGTFIGGGLAVFHLWLTEKYTGEIFYYLTVFAFIVGLIFICNLAGKGNASAIGGMIFLIVIFSSRDEPAYVYALHRLIDTAGGVLISFGVNRFIAGRR